MDSYVQGAYGYIDRSGKMTVAPQFEEASDFAEERAAVRLGGKWGYIDAGGSLVIKPRFSGTVDLLGETESPNVKKKMHNNFMIASRYEYMFWDMAYKGEQWPQ